MSMNPYQRYVRLGALICVSREGLGLQQKEAAKQIGISASFLHDIESGWRRPGMNRVEKIAEVLSMDTDALYTLMGVLPPDIADCYGIGIVLDGLAGIRKTMKEQEQGQ